MSYEHWLDGILLLRLLSLIDLRFFLLVLLPPLQLIIVVVVVVVVVVSSSIPSLMTSS